MPSVNKRMGCSRPWTIPELWKGGTVFILGGGHSLENIVRSNPLIGKKVIAIHYALMAMPSCSIWFAGDARCYWELKKQIDRFSGLKISLNIYTDNSKSLEDIPEIHIVDIEKGKGLSSILNRTYLYYNGSSGGSAIDLAAKLGAKRIILYGYDMRYSHIPTVYISHRSQQKIIDGWKSNLSIWRNIASDCNMRKIELVNCTPNSELPVITKGNLEDYL